MQDPWCLYQNTQLCEALYLLQCAVDLQIHAFDLLNPTIHLLFCAVDLLICAF